MITYLLSVAGCYALMSGCMYGFQRGMMYHPIRHIDVPEAYGLTAMKDERVLSADGTEIQLWTHAAQPGFPTLVYFHGNSASIADRAAKLKAFVDAGLGIVALSYRGFGNSSGVPDEKGIYSDARAAIIRAKALGQCLATKLIYFGESLGSGVAVQMAKEEAPGLLVLEAAYTSVETRSAELYPYILGVRMLVMDKFDSLSKIASIHAPLLMLHGEEDDVIPLSHGKTLFETANQPKTLIVYPGVHHADFAHTQIVDPVIEAARKYKLLSKNAV